MRNTNWIKRKEFDSLFATVNAGGKNVWVIHRVKELPSEVIEMALRLSSLDFIKHIRITDQTIAASSEIKGTRVKEPITELDHPTAISIEILYHPAYKVIDFFGINSPVKGNGNKMVNAVLTDFPDEWKAAVVMDWSGGFWDKMMEKHCNIEWLM